MWVEKIDRQNDRRSRSQTQKVVRTLNVLIRANCVLGALLQPLFHVIFWLRTMWDGRVFSQTCLSSCITVLWHLDVFRRSFRQLSGHACMGNSCIFCALKVIFTQFQYSDETALPPDALRKALAETFEDQQRFQLGFMDDAAECFRSQPRGQTTREFVYGAFDLCSINRCEKESILLRIHYHIANEVKEDMCNAKHCISHQKFAMTVVEQCMCGCGATSEPLPFTQMVHYVSVTAMIAQGKEMLEKTKKPYPEMFGQLLKNAGGSNCGERVQIRRMLMNSPEIVSLGLVWDTDQPTVEHIMDVINCLGTTIRLVDVFHSVVDDSAAGKVLHLVGVVTYYGKHYSTFFFHTRLKTWIYFDDATVKEIGSKWKDVVEKCRKGHYQPLLLLFADHFGSPVNTETAPTETTMLPGYTHGEGTQLPRVERRPSGGWSISF
ncbi:Ubiquitin specific peptidase 54 [Branchiostoma belcheri]|nr:Ubiquitin specific peptidase 54 [Branchiostoma belcheri]